MNPAICIMAARTGMSRCSSLVILVLGLGCGCRDQPAPVATTMEAAATLVLGTNKVTVGDVFTFTARVRHEPGERVEWPPFAQDKKIVIRSTGQTTHQKAGQTVSEWTAQAVSLEVGLHAIATNPAQVMAADGKIRTIRFPSATIEVASVLTETNATPRPYKNTVLWPSKLPVWLLGLLGSLALAAVLIGYLGRWMKQRTITALSPPPRPAHEIALAALQALVAKGYLEQGAVESFYVELSDIVRHYLENRFSLRAPELTTEEFIREAAASAVLTLAHQQRVGLFLDQADLVKFARHRPQAEDMRAALAAAKMLVHETTPGQDAQVGNRAPQPIPQPHPS